MTRPIETGGPEKRTSRIRAWLRDAWVKSAGPANLTYRWLISGAFIGFIFVGCAIYAAYTSYQTDNRVTREQVAASVAQQVLTCVTTNDRRAEAKELAIAGVDADQEGHDSDQKSLDSDRNSWESIDQLFPGGIPEPTRTVVFSGLDERQLILDGTQESILERREQIEDTYKPTDCSKIKSITDPDIDADDASN